MEPLHGSEIQPEQARHILKTADLLHSGHFVLRGRNRSVKGLGPHTTVYLDATNLIMRPKVLRQLAAGIVFKLKPLALDTIVAPGLNAVALATMVAEELNIKLVFVEKKKIARKPFDAAITDKRVGIIDTVIRDRYTVTESISAINERGGQAVAVATIWNSGILHSENVGVEQFHPLINEDLEYWSLVKCFSHGLCASGTPINRKPGYGAELEGLPEGQGLSFV